MKASFKYSLILIPLLLLYFFLCYSLLLVMPVVNNDEAVIADISFNLLSENRLGTDLHKGLINGFEKYAYWTPPLYFYANALWFKLVGFSVENFRLLNVLLGAAFITVFYFLSRSFFPKTSPILATFLAGCTSLLIVLDYVFLRASKIGRPEILVLLLFTLSATLFIPKLEGNLNLTRKNTAVIGLLLGLAFVTHFLAAAFTLSLFLIAFLIHKTKIFRLKLFYIFICAFFIPTTVWIASIYPNYNYLTEQLTLVFLSRDNLAIPWFTSVSQMSPLLLRINFSLYLLITLIFIDFTFSSKKPKYIFLSLVLVLTWVFATLGKIYWYTVYPVPFVYLALSILLWDSFKNSKPTLLSKAKKFMWISILLIFLLANLSLYLSLLKNNPTSRAYRDLGSELLRIVPPGKSIHLSSFPDVYFILKEQNLNNPSAPQYLLSQWPVFKTSEENYLQVLNSSDYIVTDGNFSLSLLSGTLQKYIEQNQKSAIDIPSPYRIILIELKNKEERVYSND